MKGIRTAVIAVIFVFIHVSILSAAGMTQSGRIGLISMWGETSNHTFFREGSSLLEWPTNMKLFDTAYTVGFSDAVEIEVGVRATPWFSNSEPMEDYDWIDESYTRSPRRAAHEGVDIYSSSTLDSKALAYDATMRVFPLTYRFTALGASLSYQYQKLDYKAYDTNQIGFGSWADQTASVTGITSNYTVEYDIYSVGLSWRVHADDFLKLTVDTAYIPYVRAEDNDNHMRRYRMSQTDCTGTGGMLSLSMQLSLSKRWFISSSCSKLHIATDGHQEQTWYGNDPASPGYDDTGEVLSGIDAEIGQNSFFTGISLGCSF